MCIQNPLNQAMPQNIQDTGGVSSASFSCNFLLAARIISSLRRCSTFCRASLLLAHPGGGDSSSLSFPFELTFACRLYRVIRSGGKGFDGLVEGVAVVESVVMNEGGGWNDGGACTYFQISIRFLPLQPFAHVANSPDPVLFPSKPSPL